MAQKEKVSKFLVLKLIGNLLKVMAANYFAFYIKNWVGHMNTYFAQGDRNFREPASKSLNA